MAFAKQYNINWKRGDFAKLGRAVANFNKKINELNKEEQKLYLPELLEYKEVKKGITTRKELNRVLNSLRRFQRQGAEELYQTEAGEQITKWERRELGIQSRIAKRRLNEELQILNTPLKNGFSRVQMGSQRAREIEAQLRNLDKLEQKTGYEFERLQRRIKSIGTTDYTLKMSYVYQQNFLEELKNLADKLPEFKEVFEYFNKIKNPISFFNATQKSNALQDFFEWYKNPEAYAGFTSTEELAEYIMNEYK